MLEQSHHDHISFITAVCDAISCMVVVLDDSGKIIYSNIAIEKISGFSISETREKYFWEVFCQPDEVNLYQAFFCSINKDNMPFNVETRLSNRRKENYDVSWEYNLHEVDGNGRLYFLLTGKDVTIHNKNIEKLQETEDRYRALIHAAPAAVVTFNNELKITSWSSVAEIIFGWAEKEVLGQDAQLFLDCGTGKIVSYGQEALEGKSFYSIEHGCACKDGSYIYFEFSISALRNLKGEVTGLVLLATNITERKNYEEQLKYLSMHDQLTGLYNRTYFDSELTSLETSNSYPLTIIAADLDGLKIINDSVGHEQGDKMLFDCAKILKDALQNTYVIARVGGDEFAVILPDTDRFTADVIIKRIKAALAVYNQRNHSLPLSMSLGVATADDLSISPLELYREADDMIYLDKLQTGAGAKSQILLSLMTVLDERDIVTAAHTRRIEILCKEMGLTIKLPQKQLRRLMLLSRVHDIGKVGIPDSILHKEGPLNDEEWKLMRKHPEKGHRIASASTDLFEIADLILKHHERWDGSGYPLGLKGEEIPVECRILSVVDAFDTMTSERPYKKPMTIESTLEELKRCAGTQFEPDMVELFFKVIRKISLHVEM
jgi:diguanylate cyclase (GGDEF)-like protein/PAS domain S-box-containing protein